MNYLDRKTLPVLAHTIHENLHLSSAGCFLVSYTVMHAVSAWMVDSLATRRSLAPFIGLWSAANMPHVLAGGSTHWRIRELGSIRKPREVA